MPMKNALLALAAAVVVLPAVSLAQTAAPAPAPAPAPEASPLSFNVGLVTDYRYRGISQSRLKPALQGGVDYALPGGFYIGTWASTIKWIEDGGTLNSVDAGSTKVEVDFYGGYKGEIQKDLSYDVGVLHYLYPSNKYNNVPGGAKADTTEIYGAVTFGPGTLKYSHALSNTFGNADSKNSFYIDLSAGFDVGGGVTLSPHVGHQKFKGPNSSAATYTDYSLGVSKDFAGFVFSATAIGTDAKNEPFYATVGGKKVAKETIVLGVKKTF